MGQSVKLGLIQTSCTSAKEENSEFHINKIREAVAGGAQIICTQELYQSLYFCQTHNEDFFDLAETVPGPTTEQLQELASELGVVIVASLFEKHARGVYYNTAVVIDSDGRYLGKYRKSHIPEDPGFHEKFYFTPGDTGYKTFDTKFGKIGLLICWDQWYPEAARLTALQGADILVYPTAIGTLPFEDEDVKKEYRDAWEIMHRSHAVANGCYVASINRVGTEGEIKFWGHSHVANPFGKLIATAGDDEEILYVDVDFSEIEKYRRTWPFLRDRRIDTYEKMTSRHL